MILFSGNKILFVQEELEDFSRLVKDTTPYYKEKWVDEKNLPHREDGPATITVDGNDIREDWYKHGVKHRIGAPAFSSTNYEGWMVDGKYHREDGPAFINKTNRMTVYYLNGKLVTEAEVRALGKMK